MDFEILGSVYEDENGENVFDVKVGKETVKGLKATKLNDSKCRKCKIYSCDQEDVCRKYDCRKNVQNLERAYERVTSFIVAVWAFFVFSYFEFGFFYKMSLLVLSLTGLDIVCTLGEECVPKIYDRLFLRKLQKRLKVEKKEKQAEQAKLKAEEEARFSNIPSYKDVKTAKTVVELFTQLSKQCDYGSDTDKIKACVENCEVIMQILEKDPSLYYGVSDLFELQLPRICTTMTLHKKAMEANKVTKEQEKLFTSFIESVLEYLEDKKNDVIYYNNAKDVKLQKSADSLRKSLQEGIEE